MSIPVKKNNKTLDIIRSPPPAFLLILKKEEKLQSSWILEKSINIPFYYPD